MRLYVIDNIDSFTYNLVHLCHHTAKELDINLNVCVGRVDEIGIQDIQAFSPDWILISPGPGHPQAATLLMEVLDYYAGKIPLLGVCLGMQAMAYWKGISVIQGEPVHGKLDTVNILNNTHPLYSEIPNPFEVVRYHSLQVNPIEAQNNTECKILANCGDEEPVIMGLSINTSNSNAFVWGVQFHPESIGCEMTGKQLFKNVFQAVKEALTVSSTSI